MSVKQISHKQVQRFTIMMGSEGSLERRFRQKRNSVKMMSPVTYVVFLYMYINYICMYRFVSMSHIAMKGLGR